MPDCPNHPDLPPQALFPIRGDDCAEDFSNCGCWRRPPMLAFERHAFRFFPGDRVYWSRSRFGPLKGVTGTVSPDNKNTARPYVIWDDHCKGWAPTSFPSNFEISHIGD